MSVSDCRARNRILYAENRDMISGNKIVAVRLECPDREADNTDNKHSMIFIAPVERWVFSFGIFWCIMEEKI